MTIKQPPMGWNSWNTFGVAISEDLVLKVADFMVKSGLRDAGYTYIVIDDGWMCKSRDKNGRLKPNPEKFPNGIAHLIDEIHQKGLKFGIYSCAGCKTCGGYPGSYQHEFVDAQTFAEWGVDFLKYDYCYKPAHEVGEVLYRSMGTALANCGREIVFSACSWGTDQSANWVDTTGAQMWRSTVDIFDQWSSIKKIAQERCEHLRSGITRAFNDMDMMVVGMYAQGNCGLEGCTLTQYRTHFSLWAFFASPLIIGCDICNADEKIVELLMNKDIIAVNQDVSVCNPFLIGGNQTFFSGGTNECFSYARLLNNGDFAIGMFNLSDETAAMYLTTADFGLDKNAGKTLRLKDLWNGEEITVQEGYYITSIEANDCRMFRAEVVDEKSVEE